MTIYAIAPVLILACFVWIHFNAKKRNRLEQLEATQEAAKSAKKIRDDIANLSDDDLDRLL